MRARAAPAAAKALAAVPLPAIEPVGVIYSLGRRRPRICQVVLQGCIKPPID